MYRNQRQAICVHLVLMVCLLFDCSSAVNELTEESERSASPPLSFLDEMKLFASTDEFKTSMSNSEHFKHVSTDTNLSIRRKLCRKGTNCAVMISDAVFAGRSQVTGSAKNSQHQS